MLSGRTSIQSRENRDGGVLKATISNVLPSVLFVSALIGCGGYLYTQSEIHYLQDQRQSQERETIQTAVQMLQERLRSAVNDIEFLVKLPHLSGSLKVASSGDLARLANEFSTYMSAHLSVGQVRWIDETGMERVRVNFVNGKVHVAAASELQDKSSRYYVINAEKLPKGGLYASPLDLNIEHDRIEVPYKPMMRFAMPVFDSDGLRRGVVVVNFLAKKWLDAFTHSVGKNANRLMLVNRSGYWLSSPQSENEWGFMLGTPFTLGLKYADAWAAMKSMPRGHTFLPSGLWTWDSIDPLLTIRSTVEQITKPTDGATIGSQHHYVWRAILRLPPDELNAIRDRVWYVRAPMLGLLFVITVLVFAWMVRSQLLVARLNRDLAKRAKTAEDVGRTKADFVANMSHEIRTPMNAVLGLAFLLEKLELPDEAKELVRKIRVAGRSLQGIINDILDFSKIEAGRIEIENASFCLGDVLDNLSTIMSTNVQDKEIELIIAPPPNLTNRLCGDALRLEQILINLTSNAIKFTDHGHVEVCISEVSANASQVTYRFAVRDTGIGIPLEKQHEIFTQFSQADTSTTRRFGGTGLGLSICRRLVELMGGEIGVNSVPGSGSEFWVTLTFSVRDEPVFSAPEMIGLNLLIVDDNAITRDALRNIATGLGWNPVTYGSGEEAVAQVIARGEKQSPNAVILIDWKMPDMDGCDVMRAIHEAGKTVQIPMILMTTAHLRESLLALPDCQLADDVLTKPITHSALYNAVARAMRVCHGVPTAPSQVGQRLAGLRILVADDSDINREVAQRIFTDEGATVVLVNDGQQALDWFETHLDEADIVLMDVQMPVMDGYEATRRIHQLPGLADLPVVALTAGVFKAQEQAAKDAGMLAFIPKPFDVADAVTTIQRLTGWKSKSSEDAGPPLISSTNGLPTASASEGNLPGLAVRRGLKVWKDAVIYRQYLRKFAQDYGDSAKTMARIERPDAAALAHKMQGAAGNLALEEVAASAREADHVLQAEGDPAGALIKLQSALDVARASIALYAPIPTDLEVKQGENTDLAGVLPLLVQAFDAFGEDNPDALDPILAALATRLPREQLKSLVTAVENFDFEGGRAATRTIAEKLGFHFEA